MPYPSKPLRTRWYEKVIVDEPDACWPWDASTNKKGRPQIRDGQHMKNAIRVGWELHFGPIPPAQVVRHNCDNTRCCNPRHWLLGTQAQNVQDMINRGRANWSSPRPSIQGERHYNCKLTNEEVQAIRSEHTGVRGQTKMLAAKFGVSASYINNLVAGRGRTN